MAEHQFRSKIGFILAAAGCAIGMGNIWMFPYRVGQNGGAAFLIPYFIFVTLFSVIGMSGEFAFGRLFACNPVEAYNRAFKLRNLKGGKAVGWITSANAVGVVVGYSVIVGWSLRYLGGSMTGSLFHLADEVVASDVTWAEHFSNYFANITGAFGSLPWHIIVVLMTAVIIYVGVEKGIEWVSKIIMPLFFLMFLGLAIYVAFLPNAVLGYKYLLVPDWSYLLKPMTWVNAMGQAFFSLSICGCTLMIYGSYMKKEVHITHVAFATAMLDTLAAILSAFVIMPAVFSFGLEPAAGPKLMFLTMPMIFSQMAGGQIISIIFFFSVLVAGITSLISLFEVMSGTFMQEFKINRWISTTIVTVVVFLIGVFLEKENVVGTEMDIVSIYWLPASAVIGAVTIFYITPRKMLEEEYMLGRKRPLPKFFFPFAKYVYVPLAFIIVILGIILGGIG